MNRSIKFRDGMAARYTSATVRNEEAYKHKLKITRKHLRSDSIVLEFGCGSGMTAITHAPFVQHVHAIDISSQMITIAKSNAVQHGIKNISFTATDIDDFVASEDSFDVILGLSILHLLENRQAALAKVYRLLKPGGTFISSTVCIGDLAWYWKFFLRVAVKLRIGPYLALFTTAQLQQDLTDAGFTLDHTWRPSMKEAVFIIAAKQ